eukprot:tig00020556_g11025.t1
MVDASGTFGPRFVLTVVAGADPVIGGMSAIKIFAWLAGNDEPLAEVTTSISYVADASSSLDAVATSVLDCPTVHQTALVPFNCTFFPKRADFVIYGIAADVVAYSVNSSASVADPPTTVATSFTITVTAAASPVAAGASSIVVVAYIVSTLTNGSSVGMALARSTVPIVYIADESSSLACSVPHLVLTAVADCTLTPRRLGELVWADAATIGFIGDGALSPVGGSLSPAAGPAQSFVFQLVGESGRLLTGPSVAMATSGGAPVANASILVFGAPDSSSTAGSEIIWARLDDVIPRPSASVKASTTMTGYATDGAIVFDTSAVPMPATVPFNCTFIPKRAGFVIYGLAENVTANATNADAVVVEPPGTLATQFTITVTAGAAPVANGSSAIQVFAWLSGTDTQLAAAASAIVYIADESSSLACSVPHLVLTAVTDCTLTPRRLGELVWADAATIGFIGDGALLPVGGSLSPAAGPAQSFAFQLVGESGRLLTGPSVAMATSGGAPVANASILVFGAPDSTSAIECPSRIWAGDSADCIFTPKMNGSSIWALLDDTNVILQNLVLGADFAASLTGFVPMLGYSTTGLLVVNTTAAPSEFFSGPGRVSKLDNCTLACPAESIPALVPFNCTFIPKRAGFVIYGLAENVAANATNADAVVVEPPGTLATQFTITVTAGAAPVANGSSAIQVFAWLSGTDTQLAAAASAIVYIADESSSLACSVPHLVLTAVADCTLTPRRLGELVWADAATIGFIGDGALSPTGISLMAPLANISVVVRGMVGSAAWAPHSPAIGEAFLISHAAPMISTGGYTLAVYATGLNGTIFDDVATTGLLAIANSTLANLTVSNITAPGVYTVVVDVTDADGNEVTSASVSTEVVLLPVLVTTVRVEASFEEFNQQFAGRSYRAALRSTLAKSYGIPEERIAGILAKPGSVILSINITATNLTEADSLSQIADAFAVQPLAEMLQVSASAIVQMNASVLDRGENAPPTPVLRGPKDVEVNGSSGFWTGKWRFRVIATDNGVLGVLPPLSSRADFDVDVVATSVVDSVDPATAKAAGETSREAWQAQWREQLRARRQERRPGPRLAQPAVRQAARPAVRLAELGALEEAAAEAEVELREAVEGLMDQTRKSRGIRTRAQRR